MKTFCIRFNTPKGRKQVAFSLAQTHRQTLYDFLASLQAGKIETIARDAIISAYGLKREEQAYKRLMQEPRFSRTEFIYNAIIAYLPELAQKLTTEAEEIKKFLDTTEKLA